MISDRQFNSIKKDETMMRKTLVVCMGITLLFLAACSPQPLQTIGATKYYVEIDDEGEELESEVADDTRYEYHLPGIDKNGEIKELTFTAGHELKQGAFLLVYDKKDEVITFEEVDTDDIPKEALELLEEKDVS